MFVKCNVNSFVSFIRNRSLCHYSITNANSLYQWNTNITNCFRRGDIETALHIFDEMPHKNVVTWNCMISGYIKNGRILEAHEVFDAMPNRNIVSFTAMLSGYARNGRLEEARSLFDAISHKNVVCWNSMISGYIINGRIHEARKLFDEMPVKNSVSWATIIEGYFHQGLVSEAEVLFNQVPRKCVSLYNTILAGYAEMGHFEAAYELFMGMPQRDVATWTSMINCLSKAGKMEEARGLFEKMPRKDVVAWTVMIRGYMRNAQIEEAQKLFNEMPHLDIVAWNSMIGGYVQNGRLEYAIELFRKMPKRDTVSWNSILLGYVQQNDMVSAYNLFDEIPKKDETSWNTLISGYQTEEALVLFVKMLQTGLKPDQGSFTCVLSVCGTLALHGWGRAMHTSVIKSGYENNSMVISSLIPMYSKCGFMKDATLVFTSMINKDTIAWNAMIVAQAYHGSALESMKLFPCMIQAGLKPDHVTFLGLLTACAHSGLVEESWKYLWSMKKYWNLNPKPEHYACMIDLLGRSGLLTEAYELVKQLPVDLPAYTWETLLSACRVHGNFEIGELVVQKIFSIQTLNVGMGVLVSNIYASREMWNDAANIRALLKHRGLKKELACSWIEMKGQICQFMYNDKSHPHMEDIYKELESLSVIIEEFGSM